MDMRLADFQVALRASHPRFVPVWVGNMIDIALKALRFARLAAEQQPSFSSDPEIAVIQQQEASFRQTPTRDRVRRYVEISETTAEFCLRAMTALLAQPDRFHSAEWDGNDFAFLQATTQSLTDQLARSPARSA